MNKQDILAMEPGRELDALVASEVLNIMKDSVNQEMFNTLWSTGLFHYSSHIHDAWQVVERLLDMGISCVTVEAFGESKFCTIYDGDSKFEVGYKTAPEAISKAALIAVMEGDKDD